jgi:hypothetical protein
LRVHEGNALAGELEPRPEIGGVENPAFQRSEAINMAESRLAQLCIVGAGIHGASRGPELTPFQGVPHTEPYQKPGSCNLYILRANR